MSAGCRKHFSVIADNMIQRVHIKNEEMLAKKRHQVFVTSKKKTKPNKNPQ